MIANGAAGRRHLQDKLNALHPQHGPGVLDEALAAYRDGLEIHVLVVAT